MLSFVRILPLLFILMYVSELSPCPGAVSTGGVCQRGKDSVFVDCPLLFESDTLLEITIETDLKELVHDVGRESRYHKAILSYFCDDDSLVVVDVELKTRGFFRKNRSNCNFPPIRVKFNRDQIQNTIFHGQNKLKIVTHCQNRPEHFNQMVLQEYLIYKAYNLFTPESYRVRLARITYQDIKSAGKSLTKFAFFIEDSKAMALRNEKVVVKRMRIHQDATHTHKITRLAVFQYLIGNTDWGVPSLHNIRLIAQTPTSQLIAVPYDFDWAALVDAPYAVPSEVLRIKSIHERLYRGYERSVEDMEFVFNEFRQKKQLLYDLYINCPYLDDKERRRVLNFFDEFYEIINNPRRAKYEFVTKSRKYKY